MQNISSFIIIYQLETQSCCQLQFMCLKPLFSALHLFVVDDAIVACTNNFE